MDFRVLGPLEVADADRAARIAGRKERAVLAALIVHLGQARAPEELVAAVWGEDAPPRAEKSLQVRLSHLRSELGDGRGLIVRDGRGYRLAVDPARVDAARFERLVDETVGRAPADALARYEQALALVRGRPYADVDEFDGLAAEVRRLDELRLRAVEGRLRALLALGRHAEALPDLERLVADEPLHEALIELYMLALYRAGRQVDALEAYRAAARGFTELGLEPSETLRRLERRILEHDEQLAAPEQAPQEVARTNVPARLSSFVGRDAELDALRDRIRNHRLVTVAGPVGVGKTSVAVEVARDELEHYEDGVWLVDVRGVGGPGDLAPAVIAALPSAPRGVELPGGEAAAAGLARDLADRHVLLVLDGCDQLVGPVAELASRLLAAASRLRVLATSRQPLGVLGEALLELRPFAEGDEAAVQLFADRAQAADPTFALGDANRPAVEEICRRLDGVPLAIELAAARLRVLPAEEIAAQLDDAALRPLGQMVAWSFGGLAAAEQDLFARLCLFRTPFTLADAQRVAATGDAADGLASLVARSLVSVEGRGYRILETLRAYGMRRLEETGDLADASRRHAEWAGALALVHGERLWSDGPETVFRALRPRRADLVAACDFACGRADATVALRLAAALGQIAFRLGDAPHGRDHLAAALTLEGGDDAARLSALSISALSLVLHGRLEEGGTTAETALGLADRLGDGGVYDRSLALRGLARVLGGDLAGGLQDFEGLEERFAIDRLDWLLGFVCGWSAFAHLVLGDLDEARRVAERGIDAFERCDDVWGQLIVAADLGRVCMALGDYDAAATALERAREVGERRVPNRLAPLLYDLGLAEMRRQRFERATELWERCVELCESPAPPGGWVLLTGLAERWYGLMAAGHLARMTDDREDARASYVDAAALLEEVEREGRDTVGVNAAIGSSLLFAGEVAAPDEAGALLREALGRAMSSADRRLTARVLDALAAHEPEPETAAALLGAAHAVRAVAGGALPEIERRGVEAVARRVRVQLGRGFDEAFDRGRADPLQVASEAR